MRRYFIDTNYLMRLILKDILEQHKIVFELFEKAALGEIYIFTSTLVFFEIYWISKSNYNFNKNKCVEILSTVLDLRALHIDEKDILIDAVNLFSKTTLELEDCYNLFYSKQYPDSEFATFDKKLRKNIKNSAINLTSTDRVKHLVI